MLFHQHTNRSYDFDNACDGEPLPIYRWLHHHTCSFQILPFDDTLCVLEPCLNYEQCSINLQFDEAAPFISSEAMLFRPIRTVSIYSCNCPQGFAGQYKEIKIFIPGFNVYR